VPVFSVAESIRVAEVLTGTGIDVSQVSDVALVIILNGVADSGSSYILDENK
jgi:hypothetical protein